MTSFSSGNGDHRISVSLSDQFLIWILFPAILTENAREYVSVNKCTLGCFIKSTDQGYAFGNVEDGTDCDDDSNSKCINGECMVRITLMHS